MRINNVVRSKKPFIFIVIFVLIFSIYNIHRTKATTLPHKTQYIILTTNNLMQSAQLIAKTRNKKYDVKIVTVEDIGSNSPSEIRNYLKKIAISKGYLLILGSENIIPRPSMYPSSTAHSVSYSAPSETKTDLYYALLNEELDKDRDLFPGELYDDRMNISPDIFVGRIPFDSNEEIKTIFNRAIQFEENPPQTAVLAASFIAYPGEIYQGARIFNGDGAREEELIATFLGENVIKLYEKSGSFPSVYKADFELTKENFYSALPNAGFVNWVAHGSNSAAYREIWNDKNENGIPDDGEFKFESFIAKDDAFKANGIFFSGSCLNENGSSNLGKAILEKGGVAFIGSTGISYSPSYFAAPHDGGTGSINYYFVKNLTAGKTVGESLYTALQEFFENDFYNNIEDPIEANLMNIYDYNLYGDPAIIWNVVEKQKECTTTKRN
ncbi:MAG: C25 family cysteine peptidase, partial [Caldisericota bacterium]|nr:C25 family cysteine peptidase [Caldisericota bacterium]